MSVLLLLAVDRDTCCQPFHLKWSNMEPYQQICANLASHNRAVIFPMANGFGKTRSYLVGTSKVQLKVVIKVRFGILQANKLIVLR